MGRLVLDAACCGYDVTGVEFSYQMLLLGDLMLNGGKTWAVAPWAEEASNHWSADIAARSIEVPDLMASEAMSVARAKGWELRMGMAAGEFVDSFGEGEEHKGSFDAVVACFFLDTAVVPSEYLLAMRHVVKKGGCVVILGPLQFHWASPAPVRLGEAAGGSGDARWARSVEVTWEEMRVAIVAAGFKIVKEEALRDVPYCADYKSMRRHVYDVVLCVAEAV